jgi:hypothetical protein
MQRQWGYQCLLIIKIKTKLSHKSNQNNNNYGQSILGLKPNSRTTQIGEWEMWDEQKKEIQCLNEMTIPKLKFKSSPKYYTINKTN